jgi:prepilin-type N-terminal cleavage/methylation domain-containing protein
MSHLRNGFTFVELSVVVVVIGILAVIVAPKFASARTDARITAVAEDIQGIVRAVDYHKANNGYWPADTSVGVMPPEIVTHFKGGNPFQTPTAIGGVFEYDNVPKEGVLRISIRSTRTTPAPEIIDALALDAYIDDGVLNTGNFRSTSGGGYTYIFNRK